MTWNLDDIVTSPLTPSRFTISESMYGRDAELQLLYNAYQRSLLGGYEMVFVSGVSGIGKSYLINELQRLVQSEQGLFVAGKFDQFKREIPYQAIQQAGRQLAQYLLTLPEEELQTIKRMILQAIGSSGQILIDMHPELEPILGKQPPLARFTPAETHNRFIMTWRSYLSVLSKLKRSLIIFLDDLQWADPASLQLISDLSNNTDAQHTMFIGAYRDQELSESHPLKAMLEKLLHVQAARFVTIPLKPLDEDALHQLISDTLRSSKQSLEPLTRIVMSRTKGNPFFVKQFVRSLYDLQLLWYVESEQGWRWDADKISELHMTDNVFDFMLKRIGRLPSTLQELLKDASCIGHEFTAQTLSLAVDEPFEVLQPFLTEAVDEGLLLYSARGRHPIDSPHQSYKFMHDRVHQAFYSLIPEMHKQELHLKLGRLLQQHTSEEVREEKRFEIVNQLNLGMAWISTAEEREQLIRLNIAACQKAKINAAHETAYRYAIYAKSLHHTDWKWDYDLTFMIHMELAELQYLCGHFEKAKATFAQLLQNAHSKLEKANVYHLMMVLYTNTGEHEEALRMGLEGLRLFNLPIQPSVNLMTIMWEMLKTRIAVGIKRPEELLDHPVISDPNHFAVMRLMVHLIAPAYYLNSELYIYLMLRMFNYSLEHGHSEGSALAYSTYSVILSSIFGRLKAGNDYGLLGLKLCDSLDCTSIKCKVYFGYGAFTSNLSEHMEKHAEYLLKAYQFGVQSGDFVYAGYSINFRFFLRIYMGHFLAEVWKESVLYGAFMAKAQDQDAISIYSVLQRYMVNMMADAEHQAAFMSGEEIRQLEALTNKAAIHTYYTLQAQAYYLQGRYEDAYLICEAAETSLKNVFGLLHIHLHYFNQGMTAAALYPSASPADQKRCKRRVRKSLRFLTPWARHSPNNFLHLKLLLEAGWYRINGKSALAIRSYERAIEAAVKQHFLHYEAMAWEAMAKCQQQSGLLEIASTSLSKAQALYAKWGAAWKSAELDRTLAVQLPENQKN
ncbi:ATP-binding protein [Paenibacillus cremeus]|uniref:AAA family ATPase n=1 Tax=Paenibacillus cremeus TaxID=2163881 RepID=A0A559KD66_9BACL|nr:AAA family ATPase [Paenibacillus cremeus]TVY10086.1 AAA family ATPase [Paenibacillus cremeus]